MKKLLSILVGVIIITSLSSCYEYHTEVVNRQSTNPFSSIFDNSDHTYEEVIIYRTNKLTGKIIKMDEDGNEIK